MNESLEPNPMPGIRKVFFIGFLTGNLFGLSYLALTGFLAVALTQNPLALLGGILGVGLGGMMLGGPDTSARWLAPLLIAGAVTAVSGLWISRFVVACLQN